VDTRALVIIAISLAASSQNPPPQQPVRPVATPEALRQQMEAFNRALGVECTHCHVADEWADASKPACAVARNMMRMVDDINGRLLADVGTVTCWSCHAGQAAPSRFPAPELEKRLAEWPAGCRRRERRR